jgi:hypothetical protein
MWTPQLDQRLLKARAEGATFSEAAERIGVSRNAALGRYARINGVVYPSWRLKKDRRAQKAAKDMRAWKEARALEQFGAAMACGVDRNMAIAQAVTSGCRASVIAAKFGITQGRVWQIVNKCKL